jgi:hypothetical protein
VTTAVDSCRRCSSPFENGDLRCAVCGHAAPTAVRDDLAEATVEVLRCEGCGAAVAYSVTARAPQCAFCGSIVRLEVPEDPLEQAGLILPFTVDRSRAEETFRQWQASLGWFRPADLRSASRLESLRALWWAGWVFDVDTLVSWTADSDAGAARADWAPHAGQTELGLDGIVVSASRGLTARETSRVLPSYDLRSAGTRMPGDEAEAVVEQFELRRAAARRHVRSELERLVAERLRDGVIPGRRFRNLHTSVLARRLVTRRLGFPAWVIAYRYRGDLYRCVLSGQDAACLTGKAPISAIRVLLAILGAVLGVLGLVGLLSAIAS